VAEEAGKLAQLKAISQVAERATEGDGQANIVMGMFKRSLGLPRLGAAGMAFGGLEAVHMLLSGHPLTALAAFGGGVTAKYLAREGAGVAADVLYKGGRTFQLLDGAEAFGTAARRAAQLFISDHGSGKHSSENAMELYTMVRKAVDQFDPDKSADAMVGQGASPEVRQAVATQQTTTVNYINSQLPPAQPADPFKPFSSDEAVSQLDIEEFLAKIEGTTGSGFLTAFKNGTLTPQHVMALTATNQHALDLIRLEVSKAVGASKDPLSMAQERQLSVLFGLNDPENAPDFIRRLQEGYGQLEMLNKAEGNQGIRPEPHRGKPMASKPYWTAADEAEEALQR
jgi:hypothetical protein